jgi:2-methylisocitrate lyase-like PEP mutase family enzyme
MGARFRGLMNGPDPLICPGAYDLMSARLCAVHGFKAVFVGSSAPNQEMVGLPDQAVVTVSEIIDYNSIIAANLDIPILADVDDFGATPLNVYRFAKQADRAGIGCAAFDDRMPMNRATAYAVPGVFPKARMIDNIHAAADARTDMVLIARCLAPTPNGSYTEMLDRAAAYAEAGADAVWIGLPTAGDYVKAAATVKKPLMAVVGSRGHEGRSRCGRPVGDHDEHCARRRRQGADRIERNGTHDGSAKRCSQPGDVGEGRTG